jgi:hypothetical protein
MRGSRPAIRCGRSGCCRIRPLIGSTSPSASSMPQKAGPQYHLRSCFSLRCCRRSTGSVRSSFYWSSSTPWHPNTFTKTRERLLNDDVMGRFLEKLMGAPVVKPLLSDEHYSVDGTLLQALASHALLERIDGEEDPPPPPAGRGRKGISAASSSATRPSAPAATQRPCWGASPTPTQPIRATGATCSWTSAMP